MTPIGSQFLHKRQQLGLSALAVATKAGIKPDHYRNIEKGRHYPRPDTIELIAEALGVRVIVNVVDLVEED